MSSPKRSSPLAKKRTNSRNEATYRNVQAGAKRDGTILVRLKALEHRVSDLENVKPFAANQRSMGYRHSTSAPASIIVKR